jgi:hypothetical protein
MVKQDRPNEASWSIWRRLLSLFSSTNDKLHQSLQSWTSFGNSLWQQWPFLCSPSLHLLYHHFENCFESHHEIRPNLFDLFSSLETIHNLPDDTIPVDITDIIAGWRTSPTTSTTPPNDTITFHYDFATYVNELTGHDATLLQRVNFLGGNPHQLHTTLSQADNLLLVSDGGADNSIGSTGWIIADSLGNRLVKGSSSIPSRRLRHGQRSYLPLTHMSLLPTSQPASTYKTLLRQSWPS